MNNPYDKYIETQVMTASPGRLLIMSYDMAIRFARLAEESMKRGDLFQQGENIRKAQDILLELSSALNPEANKKLADDLRAIYSWMFDQMTYANIRDDSAALGNVVNLLTELRTAWVEADRTARMEQKAV